MVALPYLEECIECTKSPLCVWNSNKCFCMPESQPFDKDASGFTLIDEETCRAKFGKTCFECLDIGCEWRYGGGCSCDGHAGLESGFERTIANTRLECRLSVSAATTKLVPLGGLKFVLICIPVFVGLLMLCVALRSNKVKIAVDDSLKLQDTSDDAVLDTQMSSLEKEVDGSSGTEDDWSATVGVWITGLILLITGVFVQNDLSPGTEGINTFFLVALGFFSFFLTWYFIRYLVSEPMNWVSNDTTRDEVEEFIRMIQLSEPRVEIVGEAYHRVEGDELVTFEDQVSLELYGNTERDVLAPLGLPESGFRLEVSVFVEGKPRTKNALLEKARQLEHELARRDTLVRTKSKLIIPGIDDDTKSSYFVRGKDDSKFNLMTYHIATLLGLHAIYCHYFAKKFPKVLMCIKLSVSDERSNTNKLKSSSFSHVPDDSDNKLNVEEVDELYVPVAVPVEDQYAVEVAKAVN